MNKFTKVVASALVVMMTVPLAAQAATLAELTETKNTAHEIAEKARSIGLSEDHIIIQGAQSVWWDAQNDIATGNYEAEVEKPATTVKYYTDNDVIMLAKVAYCESRGIKSKTEIACVMWTILNRYDAGFASSISGVITARNQFAYRSSAPTVSDYGYDLKALAEDVLSRWNKEKNGETNVGRVLPKGYCWYAGSNGHNRFRNAYRGGTIWNYSWGTPYES